jgi:hypothetical protein
LVVGLAQEKKNEREEGSLSNELNHLLSKEWWLDKLVGKIRDICK